MHSKKRPRIPYITVILLFASAFLIRCARPSAPTGGPKDTIPPELLAVYPPNFTTNFNAREIVLKFNEYLQLKDVQKEVLISPPLNVRPLISTKGKSVILEFPRETVLDPNTTYKIDFGGAVVDNNEGNPATRFQYVFSTGDSIDSYALSGRIVDAVTGDSVVNSLVILFEAPETEEELDSTLFKGKQLSLARTDSTGVFLATNLKDISYKIYALKDENGNGTYEPGTDLVGLTNRIYKPTDMPPFRVWVDPVRKQLYASPQIEYRIFKEPGKPAPQGVKEMKRPQQYQLQAVFNAPDARVDRIEIDSLPAGNVITEYSAGRDTVNFWVDARNGYVPDSLNGKMVYAGLDTLGRETLLDYPFKLHFVVMRDETGKVIKGNAAEQKDDRTVFQKLSDWIYDKNEANQAKRLERLKAKLIRKKNKRGLRHHRKLVRRGLIPADSAFVPFRLPGKDTLAPDSLASDSLLRDSLALDSLALDSLGLDSLLPEIDPLCLDTLRALVISVKPTGKVTPGTRLSFVTDYPVMSLDSARITLTRIKEKERSEDDFSLDDIELNTSREKDSTFVHAFFEPDSTSLLRWFIQAPLEPDADYELYFPPCAMEDLAGNVNDTTVVKFSTVKRADIGKLIVRIRNSDSLRTMPPYILNLLDSANVLVQSQNVRDTGTYVFDYLAPKKYKVRLYEDLNGNDTLDMGDLVRRIEPERTANFRLPEGGLLVPVEKETEKEIEIDPVLLFDRLYPESGFLTDRRLPETPLLPDSTQTQL